MIEMVAIVAKSRVGISREPTIVNRSETRVIGVAARSAIHRSSARAGVYMRGTPVGSTPCGSSRASHAGHAHPPKLQIGVELGQRPQHELALVRARVRQRQPLVVAHLPLVPDQVEVERAGAEADVADAAEAGLELQELIQQARRARAPWRAARPRFGSRAGRRDRSAGCGRCGEPATTVPAVWPSSAAAARSVEAGSPRFAPKPTYAHLTPPGALPIDHLYELFTFADGLGRTASRWVAARSQLRPRMLPCSTPRGTDCRTHSVPCGPRDLGGHALSATCARRAFAARRSTWASAGCSAWCSCDRCSWASATSSPARPARPPPSRPHASSSPTA